MQQQQQQQQQQQNPIIVKWGLEKITIKWSVRGTKEEAGWEFG